MLSEPASRMLQRPPSMRGAPQPEYRCAMQAVTPGGAKGFPQSDALTG